MNQAVFAQRLNEGLASFSLFVDKTGCERLFLYMERLRETNRRFNLTTLTEPEVLLERHFIDSLAPLRWIVPRETLLDLGSGAGFPGLPLALQVPRWRITVAEATQKKAQFLQEIVAELGLDQVTVAARHVDKRDKAWTQTFDQLISRATFSPERCPRLGPLLGPGKELILLRGRRDLSDRPFPKTLGMETLAVIRYQLPFSQAERHLYHFRATR